MRFSDQNRCQPCRSSKKKCDGGKPACQRCVRMHKTCHGYRPAFGTIHIENVYANRQRQRPKGPRTITEQLPDISKCGMSRDIQSEAIAYYMTFHVPPTDVRSAPQSDMRQVVTCVWRCAGIEDAISSLAISIFSKVKCLPLEARHAAIRYQGSLHTLQTTLADLGNSGMGACLLATCFLARYEDSVFGANKYSAIGSFQQRPGRLHHAGIIALLEHWSKRSTCEQEVPFAVTYGRRLLRKAALLGQADFPKSLENGSSFGERGAERSLDGILVRLINLRSWISALRKPSLIAPENLEALQDLHREALAVDRALLGWLHVCSKHAYDPRQSNTEAAARVQCYGYRMLACHSRIQALEVLDHHLHVVHNTLEDGQRLLNSLAHDLTLAILFYLDQASIPIASGLTTGDDKATKGFRDLMPYDTEPIIIALVIASTTPYVETRYTEWFRKQLACAGRSTGYGLTEAVASGSCLTL